MDATDLKAPAPERPSLIIDYRPVPGVYDEMMDADGRVRAHWQAFLNNLQAMPPDDIGRCWETARRLVRENGVTYNVYADPKGADRPWELDLLPLILSQEEWSGIEAAVVQRATLLNAILLDVYGEQDGIQ